MFLDGINEYFTSFRMRYHWIKINQHGIYLYCDYIDFFVSPHPLLLYDSKERYVVSSFIWIHPCRKYRIFILSHIKITRRSTSCQSYILPWLGFSSNGHDDDHFKKFIVQCTPLYSLLSIIYLMFYNSFGDYQNLQFKQKI